jgi:hypothetical protein
MSSTAITAESIIESLPGILEERPELRYKFYAIIEEKFPLREETNRILEEIKSMREESNKRFEAMDKRFEAVDKRFEEARVESNKRFEAMDKRFEAMDKRFEAMDKRFEEARVESNKRFEAMDKRFEEMHEEIMSLKSDIVRLDSNVREIKKGQDEISINLLPFMRRGGYHFENTVRGVIEMALKIKGGKIEHFLEEIDGEEIERDAYVHNGEKILFEIKSRIQRNDVSHFIRDAKIAEKKLGKVRLVMIGFMIEDDALEYCDKAGIEVIDPNACAVKK